MFQIETQLFKSSVEVQTRITHRRNMVIVFLIVIAVSFLIAYTVTTVKACL